MTDSTPGPDVGDAGPAASGNVASDLSQDPVSDGSERLAVDDLTIDHGDAGGIVVTDDLERVTLFGLDLVNADSLDPVVEELLYGPRRDDDVLPLVLTPNVDILVHLDEAPDSVEAEMFRRAQYCLPDGQPLVIVSRFLGRRLRARLPGSGLFAELWPRLVAERLPVLVVASSDDVARRLEREHPKAGFIVPPMFDADDEGAITEIVDNLLAAARATRPGIIFVGIGNPKDARIIASLFERWDLRLGPKPLCLGLGGSFAMYLGLKKRAPAWIQTIGMEWFYRFLQEPRRLFHRYFVRDMAFFGIVGREWRRSRAGR